MEKREEGMTVLNISIALCFDSVAKDADKGFGQGSACLNKGRDIKISGTVADTSSLMN